MNEDLSESEKLRQDSIKRILDSIKWWEQNCFRCYRYYCAIALSFAVVFLSISLYTQVLFGFQINEAINDQIHTLNTWTITETISPKSDNPLDPSKDSKTEKKIEVVNSASPIVWAYGLQLAAWTGVLGMLLWAIVALCRED